MSLTRRLVPLASLITLVTLAWSSSAQAGINSWTMTGPEGGPADAIAYQPTQGGIVLASTPRGLYRSTDEGLSWTLVLETYPQFQQIAFDPSNPNRIFAVNNSLWRSLDSGITWALAPQPLADEASMVGVSPAGNVYVSSVTGTLRRSADQGASWSTCARPYSTSIGVRGLTVDPNAHAEDRLFILVSGFATGESGVWRSVDGCTGWAPPGANDPGRTASMAKLVVKPGSSNRVLLATSGGIHASDDAGATWVQNFFIGTEDLVFDPTNSNQLAAVIGLGQMILSFDSGTNWATNVFSTQTFGPHKVALSPTIAGRLLQTSRIGVTVADNLGTVGVIRRGSGLRSGFIGKLSPAQDGSIFAVQSLGVEGVFRRDPATGVWQPLQNSAFGPTYLNNNATAMTGVAVAPSDSSRLFAWTGPLFLRSTNGGNTWQGPDTTLQSQNVAMLDLRVDPVNPLVAYGITADKGLWKTSNGGVSWARSGTGLPDKLGALVIAPSSSSILYVAGTVGGTGETVQVYRSSDQGATWTAVGATPPFPNTNEYITALSVSPHNANVVFATMLNQVHKSIDAGATWEVMTFPNVAANLINGSTVRVDPVHSGTILVASSRYKELMRTVNGGQSWEATPLARPDLPTFSTTFELDPTRPGRVISSVWFSSVAEYEFATDLSVSMASMSNSLPVGLNTPVRFTVRNRGPHAASPSDLRIDIPPNTGASWPAGCSLGMQVIYCRVPALQVNAEHEINLYLHPLDVTSGNIAASLTPHETDTDSSNNSTSFAVAAGQITDIDLTLTATPSTLDRGTTTQLVAVLINHGPNAANDVRLNLSGLSDFVVTSVQTDMGACNTSASPTCNFGTMAAEASATVRLTLRADTFGIHPIIGAATAATLDADGQNSTAYLPINVTRVADVAASITESADPVVLDSPLRYTVNVQNLAGDPGPAQLVVSVGGAPILSAVPNTGTCTSTATTVTCDFVPTPGAALTMDLGTATAGIVTATATVTYGGTDSNPANNTQTIGTTVRRTADLNVSVAPSVTASALDTEFTFTTTVRNDGPNAAPVALNINLQQAQVVSATVAGGTCTNTATLADCTLPSLAYATSATFTVRARGATPGSATAVATVTSSAFDTDSSDNQATSAAVVLSRVGDVAVSITDSEDPATTGRAFNYTATVQNLGPNAGDVHLVVPVTGATVTGATPSAGNCTTTASQVTCDMLALASGASATVRIDVNAASAGTAQAASTVTFSGTDAVATNNTATASTVVNAPPSSSSSGGGGGGGGGGRFDWLALGLLGVIAWRRWSAAGLSAK